MSLTLPTRRRAEHERVELFVSAIRATARPIPPRPRGFRIPPRPVDTVEISGLDLLLGYP